MEELIRTTKTVIGLLFALILGRVLYDILLSEHEDSSHWALAGLTVMLISTIASIIVESYMVELPVWISTWQLVDLLIGVLSVYAVILVIKKGG